MKSRTNLHKESRVDLSPFYTDPFLHWKKMIGKLYSRKSNVRFDEGELETGP